MKIDVVIMTLRMSFLAMKNVGETGGILLNHLSYNVIYKNEKRLPGWQPLTNPNQLTTTNNY